MEESDRASLAFEGRDTMDQFLDDRQDYERRNQQLQSELYNAQQIISSLSTVGSSKPDQKLLDMATENSKLREELSNYLKAKEEFEVHHREALNNKQDLIDEFQQKLLSAETDRDKYLVKCQELEHKLSDFESYLYQDKDGRPTVFSPKQDDRIQKRLQQEAQDSRVNEMFGNIDQTELFNSVANQTQGVAENMENHVQKLVSHRSNILTLYEQLKHTARFLTEIVHVLGMDNDQIELVMQKINKLKLDMDETNEVSQQIVNEARQITQELSSMSLQIEQSVRQSVAGVIQSSFVDNSQSIKPLADLNAKNAELLKQIDALTEEATDLKSRLDNMHIEHENVTSQLSDLTKTKRELFKKYENAVKLIEERDAELENRENIIEQLREFNDASPKLPENLDKDIENQLQHIYATLVKVNGKFQKSSN